MSAGFCLQSSYSLFCKLQSFPLANFLSMSSQFNWNSPSTQKIPVGRNLGMVVGLAQPIHLFSGSEFSFRMFIPLECLKTDILSIFVQFSIVYNEITDPLSMTQLLILLQHGGSRPPHLVFVL